MKRLNILLITADQMRGDCIGALGHPDVETPNLDTMVNQGTAFTRCYSATPTCIPARAALFTGQSQEHHGRVGYQDGVDWEYPVTMPGEFTRAGYHTHCAGKMHVWPPRSLLGFCSVDLHDGFLPYRATATPARQWMGRIDDYLPDLQREAGPQAGINDLGIGCNSWVARPWDGPERLHPTNWTAQKAADFLRRRDPTRPFFLWASFVAPHPPYLPPAPYFAMYSGRDLRPPVNGAWASRPDPGQNTADGFTAALSEAQTRRMQAGYYGSITHLDHQIGRLLRELKDEGVLQDTVILFTSDHGEMLGDHYMLRKSQGYQGSVHVPLVLYDPGGHLGLPQGRRCEALAELRDVMPTLLAAAGLPVPATVDGMDLAACARGAPGRGWLHGEHTAQQGPPHSMQYILMDGFKYLWYSHTGAEQLFDLQRDPGECRDLASDPAFARQKQAMRARLVQALAGRPEGYSDGAGLKTGCPPLTVLPRTTI